MKNLLSTFPTGYADPFDRIVPTGGTETSTRSCGSYVAKSIPVKIFLGEDLFF